MLFIMCSLDKYQKIRSVGKGSFGNVYLYKRKADKRPVVIKQIPMDDYTPLEKLNTLDESRFLAMLDHPFIVEYFESFIEDETMMIVMEYMPGGTLFEFLQQRDELLDEKEILRLFSQILLGLNNVHTFHVLHRDLKSQNVLMSADKTVIKICDFGIAKILDVKTKAYTVLGTPSYICPERCEGKPYDQKSDIWSLGCILYEMTTLKQAFEAETVANAVIKIMNGVTEPIPAQYSSGLNNLIAHMLCMDPNERPSTKELIAEPILFNILHNLYTDIGSVLPVMERNQRKEES